MKIKGIILSVEAKTANQDDGAKLSFTVCLEGQNIPTSFVDLPFTDNLAETIRQAMISKGEVDFEL